MGALNKFGGPLVIAVENAASKLLYKISGAKSGSFGFDGSLTESHIDTWAAGGEYAVERAKLPLAEGWFSHVSQILCSAIWRQF